MKTFYSHQFIGQFGAQDLLCSGSYSITATAALVQSILYDVSGQSRRLILSAPFQRLPANHVASNSIRIHVAIAAVFLIPATFFVDPFVVGSISLTPLADFSTPIQTHTQYSIRDYELAVALYSKR